MFVSGRRSTSNNINNSRSTSADQSTGLHEQQQKLHQNLLQFNEQQKRYNLISDVSNQEIDRVPAASHSTAPANQQNTENNEKDQLLHYNDLLAPPPSFQDERLALLRHLKETPRLVTASTQLMESSLNLGNGNNNNNNTLRSSPLRANSEPEKQQHPSPLRMFRPVLVSPSNINNVIDHNNSNNQTLKIMLESSKSPSPRPQQNNRTVVRSSLDGVGVGDDVPLYELPNRKNNSSSSTIKLELLESQERQEWIMIALHEELPEIWRKFMREHVKIIQKESSRRAENSSRQLLLDALGGGRGGGGFGSVGNPPRDISIEALVRAIENAHFVRLQETSQIMDRMSSDLKNCRAREVDLLEQLEELKEYHIDTVNLMTRKFESEKELVLKKSEETLIDRVRRMAKRVKNQDQQIMSVLREVADENNTNENINSARRVRESVALSQSPSRSASQQQQQVHHHHYYDGNSRSGSAVNNQNNSDQENNNNNNTNQNQLQFALKVLETIFSNSQSSVNPPSRSTSTLMSITGTNTKSNQDDQIVTNDAKQLKHSTVVNSTAMPPLAPSSLMHPASTSSNTISPVVVKISRLRSQIPERVPSSKVIISPVVSPKNSSPSAPLATHQNQDDVIGGEEFVTAESSGDSHDDVAGLNKTNPPELQQQIQQPHHQQHAPRISVSLIQPIQPVSSGYRKPHQHHDNNNDDDGNDDVILARPSISSDNQKSRSSGRFDVVPAISSRSGSVNHNEAAAVVVEAPPKRFHERNENNENNGRFRVRIPTTGNNGVPQQQGSYPEFHQLMKQGISPYFHDE